MTNLFFLLPETFSDYAMIKYFVIHVIVTKKLNFSDKFFLLMDSNFVVVIYAV